MNYLQIPSALWPHISRLSGLQLAIYCDAVTWGSQGKEARRSNDTLAEMFGVTSRAISKSVARLVEMGLVDLEVGPNNIRTIKPRTTVHLNECSPRTTVHPERVFTPTLNECSGQHGTSVQVSPERVFTLDNQREEQGVNQGGNQKVREKAKAQKFDVVMPFGTDTFKAAWDQWKAYKSAQHRFTFKSSDTEQIALHQLQKISNNDERTAVEIIGTSIANGWKGLFPGASRSKMAARPGTSGYMPSDDSGSTDPFAVIKDSRIWG